MPAEFIEKGYHIKIDDFTPAYRNQYVASVSWMSGDADVYTYTDFVIEPRDLIRSIKALSEANGLRLGSWNDEDAITPDIAWFFGGALSEDEYNILKQRNELTDTFQEYIQAIALENWERDRSCDDCGNARLDEWKLTYYDNAGLPHNVEVYQDGQLLTSSYWRV